MVLRDKPERGCRKSQGPAQVATHEKGNGKVHGLPNSIEFWGTGTFNLKVARGATKSNPSPLETAVGSLPDGESRVRGMGAVFNAIPGPSKEGDALPPTSTSVPIYPCQTLCR